MVTMGMITRTAKVVKDMKLHDKSLGGFTDESSPTPIPLLTPSKVV